MEGFEIGVAHQQLCDRLTLLEGRDADRQLADALLLERIQVLESASHHHSEDPEPQEEEHQEEVEEEQEEQEENDEVIPETEPEPEEEPVAEVPPERKHLLHRVIWSR